MNPAIQVVLMEGPLGPSSNLASSDEEIGAIIIFEGIVRRKEAEKNLESLRYEAYEPMTQNELRKLSQEIMNRFQLKALSVEHSIGKVPVGTISFRLTLASSHRAEAIAACDTFIETMKKCIPLWKCPVYLPE